MPHRDDPPHLAHLKYRPDIDGLRAVAVLAVVGFHASPHWVRGGFVGVDIFFVISGFLISTILFGSLGGQGFSYAEFYARRIRRIFPALVVVLAATFAFGGFVLLSDEFRQLGKHTLASAAFVQNLVLWGDAGYFDTAAESKPLLHLWSLAVEEQFYIFWPLVLGLAWRRPGRGVLVWMGVAIGLSFLLNVATVFRYPDAAFYSPLTRVWELGAGAVLAYLGLRRQPHRVATRREWLGGAGLLLIAVGLVAIHRSKAFPGFWALLPVGGACLCIAAGPGAWINRHILGSRPFVWIGLISYPLYLWHWPLLAYARVLENGMDPPRAVRFGAVAVSVLLAWATYRWVERPLRRRDGTAVVAGLALAMGMIALMGALAWSRVLQPRHNDPSLQAIVAASSDWAYPDGMHATQINGQTVYRVGEGRSRVLLVGDSHVEQYGPRAVELARTRPEAVGTLTFATRGACPPIPRVLEDRDPICGERFDAMLRYALSPQVDRVVVGGCWTCYFDIGDAASPPAASAPPPPDRYYYLDEQGVRHYLRGGDGVERALQSLATMLKTLQAAGKKTYVLLNIPVGPDFEPRSRLSGSRLGAMHAAPVTPRAPMSPSQRSLHDRLRRIAQDNGATVLDPLPTLCTGPNACVRAAGEEGNPVYKDAVHLRAEYVRKAATYLDPALLQLAN